MYDSSTPNPVPALLEEVILSYRLFFAQHRRSLERYRHLERKRLEDEDYIIDPLLDELCGCMGSSFGNFLPKQFYDTQFDFPILGTRLLFIQEYIVNQQPSGFKELWNDRRDGLRWFTFWAVVFFGTLGVVLSILQLAASVMQTYISWKAYQAQLGQGAE